MDAKPLHQQPERPEFWDHRLTNSVTPWDAGGAPPELAGYFFFADAPKRSGESPCSCKGVPE